MNIAEELIILLSTYTGIILLAFFMQLITNFVIVFSIRKNTKEIKEMLQEIYLPYRKQNDYERSIKEEEINRRNSIMEEIRKQEEEETKRQQKEKIEQDWNEIKNALHTELNPKTATTAIIVMIIGIIAMALYFIFVR